MSCILTIFGMSLFHCWSTRFNPPDFSIPLFSSSWPASVCLNELVNSQPPEAWQCPVVQQIAMPLSPLVLDFVSWADHLLLQAFVQCSIHFCCHCFNCWFESCDLWHWHLAILCKLCKAHIVWRASFCSYHLEGAYPNTPKAFLFHVLHFIDCEVALLCKLLLHCCKNCCWVKIFLLLRFFQSLEGDLLFSLP